ncbi:capsular polysaccharide export protein, LipB/KpsS family [Novosphingobium aureum]|uniref:capsular polysaccharide export protein, LipB/KpsS family n=1 Tax=Novosphingobium aureum TaxID=2792964 RepID=UPI002B46B4BA|nr:hypothetical protein [Novosphingobium aureum]
MKTSVQHPPAFLRIPPFPGHRAAPLAVRPARASSLAECEASDGAQGLGEGHSLLALLREHRVGGPFWGPGPDSDRACLPATPSPSGVVICASHARWLPMLIAMARREFPSEPLLVRVAHGAALRPWVDLTIARSPSPIRHLAHDSDPWALCSSASLVIADAEDEAALVARVLQCRCRIIGQGRFARLAGSAEDSAPGSELTLEMENTLASVVQAELADSWCYRDPFSAAALSPHNAIELLARWRRTIHENRKIHAVFGVARWKRPTVDPLLWDGTGPVRHRSRIPRSGRGEAGIRGTGHVVAWRARCTPRLIDTLERQVGQLAEIEDGLIRSSGLGAHCVPPLSIVLDPLGAHFDPTGPSTIETLLRKAEIPSALCARARDLRERLVAAGIGKYGAPPKRPPASGPVPCRKHRVVLVVGQVADDRAMAGTDLDNLALLRRARKAEPDAHIVYRPHPDVEAGHRKGALPDELVLNWADTIDRESLVAALLEQADTVHVISSLTGFEALLRGCKVVTHAMPFYAGWGLTLDCAPVPARRDRVRSLDELVACALILYPRYTDPVTRLPCTPEVLVARLAGRGQARARLTPLIALRRAQGALRRLLTGRFALPAANAPEHAL